MRVNRCSVILAWALAATTVAAQETFRFEVASVRPNTSDVFLPGATPQ
jgi:hypothetical protein